MVTIRNIAPQFLVFPVQRFQQGGRVAYSLVMDLATLDDCIPVDVDPEHIKNANRRFIESHSRRIEKYLHETKDWVLGAILLGIDPTYSEFVPYTLEDGQLSDYLGELRIPLGGGTSSIKILDGQHRRKAIQRVRESIRQEVTSERNLMVHTGESSRSTTELEELLERFKSLNEMSIPVIFYEEANIQSLRRMFSDLAQTRPISGEAKTRFDDRDPFNRAAVELVEFCRSDFLANKVEIERPTPAPSGDYLLSINQLARCLKILQYGYGGRANRDRLLELQRSYDMLVDYGLYWADEFLPASREEYEELQSDEQEKGYVASRRSSSAAYSAPTFQILAGCLYEWESRKLPWNQLADWIRNADFNFSSKDCIFLKSGMLIPGDSSLIDQEDHW